MLRCQTKTRDLVTTVARSSMQKMPLLEVTRVIRKMRLAVQPLALLRDLAHPAHSSAVGIQNFKVFALLPELLRYSLNIYVKVVAEEFANFGILMVADQRRGFLGIRRIDVDVCG